MGAGDEGLQMESMLMEGGGRGGGLWNGYNVAATFGSDCVKFQLLSLLYAF